MRSLLATNPPVVPTIIGGALAATVLLVHHRRTRTYASRSGNVKTLTSSPPTPLHQFILDRCPSLATPYNCHPLLFNGHVETIFAALFRRDLGLQYQRELLLMPDNGTVAIDWPLLGSDATTAARTGTAVAQAPLPPTPAATLSTTPASHHPLDASITHAPTLRTLPPTTPILILLPGLTGGSHDTYVQSMVIKAREAGFRPVVFNSRGTSDSPVTTPQFYSASFTKDLERVIAHVQQVYPLAPLVGAGWSLGANILVKYLGEHSSSSSSSSSSPTKTPLLAAVSLCNPFDLVKSDRNFEQGFNRLYDANLARSLRKIYAKHAHLFSSMPPPFQPELAANCKSIREFDEALTRVSFGWPSVDAYYAGSSSSLSIPHVQIPLLCIQAEDDPIAPIDATPFDAIAANENCMLVTTPSGGHLGWCAGPEGVRGGPWPEQLTCDFLHAVLEHQAREKEKSAKTSMGATTI